MNISLTSIKPNLRTSVGDLSTKRIQKLDELLLSQFPEKKELPDNEAVAYIDPKNKSLVLVGKNQISFGLDDETRLTEPKVSISNWKTLTEKIIDIFLLDSKSGGYEFDFTALVDAYGEEKNAASKQSLQKFSTIHRSKLKEFGNPIAVGFRYVFKNNDAVYDCRVEPFLADLSKFYLTMNVKGTKGSYSNDNIFQSLEEDINLFTGKWFESIKESVLI